MRVARALFLGFAILTVGLISADASADIHYYGNRPANGVVTTARKPW